MAVLNCDKIDYRNAISKAVVDEKKKEIYIYLNTWLRYCFRVDEMVVKKRKGGNSRGNL